MTISTRKALLLAAVFCISTVLPAAAERVDVAQFGCTLDLPEGFRLSQQTPDQRGFLLDHEMLPVQLAVRILPAKDYKTSADALDSVCTKLKADGQIDDVSWRGTDACIAQFTMVPGFQAGETYGNEQKKDDYSKEKYAGWGCAALLTSKTDYAVILAYSPEDKAKDCAQFQLSILDSLMIDRGSYYESGIVTAYAFPPAKKIPVTLNIAGKKIQTELDSDDTTAAKFVIDREYAVLSIYANSPLWKEAWQRYYRQIFRDSSGRLKKAAFDIQNAFLDETPQQLAQTLLTWTQGFQYARDGKSSDFTSLPAVLLGEGNDCDSRSLLLAVLLNHMNSDTCIFVSHEYSHAVVGVVLDAPGAAITAGGKKYLLGETTAHVDLGKMAAEMNDTSKWIPVLLP